VFTYLFIFVNILRQALLVGRVAKASPRWVCRAIVVLIVLILYLVWNLIQRCKCWSATVSI